MLFLALSLDRSLCFFFAAGIVLSNFRIFHGFGKGMNAIDRLGGPLFGRGFLDFYLYIPAGCCWFTSLRGGTYVDAILNL